MVYEPKILAGETMCVASEREEVGKWAPQVMEVADDDRNWLKK